MAAKGIAPLRPGELLTGDLSAVLRRGGGGAGRQPGRARRPARQGAGARAGRAAARAGAPLLRRPHRRPTATRCWSPSSTTPSPRTRPSCCWRGRLRERELEVMFQNEARILRCPAILEALYFNPQARMSSLNRAIELCARNGVRVEGIPSFDEVAKSIAQDASRHRTRRWPTALRRAAGQRRGARRRRPSTSSVTEEAKADGGCRGRGARRPRRAGTPDHRLYPAQAATRRFAWPRWATPTAART